MLLFYGYLVNAHRANITIAIRWEVRYLPSNGATANVGHHDFDKHFQDHEFLNVNSSKTVRAKEKFPNSTFIEVNIYQRMEPLQNVVYRDFDLNFQGSTFQVTILTIIARNANITIASDRKSIISLRMVSL